MLVEIPPRIEQRPGSLLVHGVLSQSQTLSCHGSDAAFEEVGLIKNGKSGLRHVVSLGP
jgi:hypothetical protein